MLYNENLLLKDAVTLEEDLYRSLVQSPTPRVGVVGTAWYHTVIPQPSERWIEHFVLPPLKGPNGQQWAGNQSPYSIMSVHWFITDKCKDPELAIALYDYLLGHEVTLSGYWGPKGDVWDDSLPGTSGLLGGPSTYRMLKDHADFTLNGAWGAGFPLIASADWFYGGQQSTAGADGRRWLETGDPSLRDKLLANTDYAEAMWNISATAQQKWAIPDSYFIPPLVMNDADNTRIADIGATLSTYKSQAWVEFITGVRNISNNADWNAYLADLDRYGAAEHVSIMQKYIK
jgi:putative aldouronate transport system substrate-binding protein